MFERLVHQLRELCSEDRGADLVEYALIASIIALAGVVAFPAIGTKLTAAFSSWGQNVYNAWEPNPPQ